MEETFVDQTGVFFFQVVRLQRICLPIQETQVWSLGQEDTLDKGMATQFHILAWKIHGQRSLVGYNPWGRKESDTWTTEHTHKCFLFPTTLLLHQIIYKILFGACIFTASKANNEKTY